MATIIGLTSIVFLIKVLALSKTKPIPKVIAQMRETTICSLIDL